MLEQVEDVVTEAPRLDFVKLTDLRYLQALEEVARISEAKEREAAAALREAVMATERARAVLNGEIREQLLAAGADPRRVVQVDLQAGTARLQPTVQ